MHGFPFLHHHKHIVTTRAQVRFLATGMLLRVAQGLSHDEYLVTLSGDAGKAQPEVARLVDDYINFAPPIPPRVQTANNATEFELLRDSSCDLPYQMLKLRSAPGDLAALFPAPMHYTPVLDVPLEASTVIPCYRTVRKSGILVANL